MNNLISRIYDNETATAADIVISVLLITLEIAGIFARCH